VEKAMERRGMTLTAAATYERNTTEVSEALATIKAVNPEAVVMVGAYAPIAEFIRTARHDGMDPTFVTISFVGSMSLLRELGADGAGVIVSQVVPFPLNGSIPVVAEYQQALFRAGKAAELDFVSLEGYLVGLLAVKALEETGPGLTRDKFLATLNAMTTVDLGGIVLEFGPDDNQGSDEVHLTRISTKGAFEDLLAAEAAAGQ
jgi:ABC-type branched-subunit amino acid transport system substrate-binding protein